MPGPRTPLLPFTVLMGGLLVACGTPPAESPSAVSPSASPTASSATSPSPPRASETVAPTAGASRRPVAETPPPIALSQVAGGVADPINVAATPDGWLLVNERAGRVVAVDPEGGATAVSLDITDRVLGQGEQGLLGLAIHPDWADDDLRAFVHYTDRSGDTVLSEFSVIDFALPPRLDASTERVLLRVDQPFANHNGGQVAFGPDGMLYLGLGDGGSGGDPQGNGQDPGTLLGSILRIDVDGEGDAERPYAVPPDNPFVDGGGAPEVFLYGLRNPWRFSFDRATGQLWIADVGQNAYEEINRLDPTDAAGGNLGWNVTEASHCFADAECDPDAFIGPVSEYGRDAGCSVTGGHVYRGEAIPDLVGWYVFADYCSGRIFGIPSDVRDLTAPRTLLESGLNVSAFGEGADGELYLADLAGGGIYRLVPGG